MKELMEDIVDVKPLPEVTTYAGGTCLMGVAFGIFAGYSVPWSSAWVPWVIIGTAYIVGVVLTMRGFSRLKRKFRIVPIEDAEKQG